MNIETRPAIETEEYWESLIKKSVSRYFLLGMLAGKPMHGYELAGSIETCCEGWSRPTTGMIYPTIKELLESGHIECVEEMIGGRQRKVCHLTESGREAYRAAARTWARVLPFLAQSVEGEGIEIEWKRRRDCAHPSGCGCG
jgi:DNA-binding PadR family transcriptional regulator